MRVLVLTAAALFAAFTGAAHGASPGFFKTPSGNIVCYGSATAIDCGIKTGLKPKPARRDCNGMGDYTDKRLYLGRTGKAEPTVCEGDANPLNSAGQAKVLRYGRSITFGRLKCTSSEKGLSCRNRSHGFFLSRGSWKRI